MTDRIQLTPMELEVLKVAHMKTVEAISLLDEDGAIESVQNLVEAVEDIIEGRYTKWESDGAD